MTQAGENSAGGARRPEDGKPRSRHPGLSSKPPSCEPAPGPARPGARARGPVPGRVPARPVQANMDRRKPGTSPPKDRARVRARLGPGPAGGPARKAKGGVRGSAADGGRGRAEEKKTKNCLRPHRTHQQHCGKKGPNYKCTGDIINKGSGRRLAAKYGGRPTNRTRRGHKEEARPPEAQGEASNLRRISSGLRPIVQPPQDRTCACCTPRARG
jgi:hypothetical protein